MIRVRVKVHPKKPYLTAIEAFDPTLPGFPVVDTTKSTFLCGQNLDLENFMHQEYVPLIERLMNRYPNRVLQVEAGLLDRLKANQAYWLKPSGRN